jgi:hypothetical protein
MSLDLGKIVEYERIMPLCMQPALGAMPGSDVILRDDLALISSLNYPSPDSNHACLLRTSAANIEALIDEVIEYFKSRDLPATIFTSPACSPVDLPERLLRRGFVKQEPDESWLALEHLQTTRVPKVDPKITVRQVEKAEVKLFAEVMAAAYEMPAEWLPMLLQVLEPTIGLPDFRHYLAFANGQPLATITVMRHEQFAVVGSAGVLPEQRGSSLIYNLTVGVLDKAQQEGVDTIILQTTLGPLFERLLRIYGFKFAFKRSGYTLA